MSKEEIAYRLLDHNLITREELGILLNDFEVEHPTAIYPIGEKKSDHIEVRFLELEYSFNRQDNN